jgi:hypothetical protein
VDERTEAMHARTIFLALLLAASLLSAVPAQAATPRGAERAVARAVAARWSFDSVYASCRALSGGRFECQVDAYRLEADSAFTAHGYVIRSAQRWTTRIPKPRRCGCLDSF